MRRMVIVLTALVVMSLGIFRPALAWDGERQGFLLGLGLGLDVTHNMPEFGDDETEAGIGTEFKFGFAFTNQVMLLYTNKVGWLSVDDVTVTDGLSALGVNYYLNPAAPSFFFGGGIGVASRDAPFEDDAENVTGLGLFLEMGYEFARHWSVTFNLRYGNPEDDDWSTEAISAMVMINVMGY